MLTRDNHFNRLLFIILAFLILLSLSGFLYANNQADPQAELWTTAVNALILSLPLILFYGAIYVLVRAWRERRTIGHLAPALAKIVHWAPRAAAILIIFFISLFSLDAFEAGRPVLEQVGAFIIHSLPSIVMILLLVIAWRRPAVGFAAFLVAGIFFLRFVIFNFDPAHFLLFSGPLLLISALFYADWRWNRPEQVGGGVKIMF